VRHNGGESGGIREGERGPLLSKTQGGRKAAAASYRGGAIRRKRRENVEAYYLLKTEPTEYSFADLQKDGETEWDGVSNPVAVRHLSEMKPGSRLVIYETGDRKSAVGTATVVSVTAKDPKKPIVEIKAGKALAKPVSLAEIKQNKIFKDSPLVRMGRLSVVPLTKEQYGVLVGG
jgi:predicted RNA-binding protein with PUA-like domain